MLKYLPLLFLLACGIDRDIPNLSTEDEKNLKEYFQLAGNHQVIIQESNGVSEPLIVCLTFIDAESKQSINNQQVHFYHADINGEYQPKIPGDETTARLNGQAITNSEGRILLQTTLPGDYGSSADNRHIHTTVFGASPEAYDIHFNQYTGFMGSRFIEGSDQHFSAYLQRDSSGKLVTFLTIEVKNPKFLP